MAQLRALIFDCDGVIAETEADGHRVAFNQVFKEEGIPVQWDIKTYGEMLKIAGGKERMRPIIYSPDFKKDVGDKEEYIKKLHKRKTDIYMELIETGKLKARPGVARLIKEAHKKGIKLAVASTSNERGVISLIKKQLGEEIFSWFDVILAGDVVKSKKPDPEIYILASQKLGIPPEDCLVIEDTENGVKAAKAAGMKVLVTKSEYSKNEEFPEADLVVDSLGRCAKGGVTIEQCMALFK